MVSKKWHVKLSDTSFPTQYVTSELEAVVDFGGGDNASNLLWTKDRNWIEGKKVNLVKRLRQSSGRSQRKWKASMQRLRSSCRNDFCLFSSLPASLPLSLHWITEREHLVAVITQTKLFSPWATLPQSIFFIKGGPKQNTNKVLLTFYNGNKTRPGSSPPTGLFRWTHFTSILELGERKLNGEFKLKRKGKEGRGAKLLAPPTLINLPSSNQRGPERENRSKSSLVINWIWVPWLLQAARLACRSVHGSHMAALA